ncbi:MogA/MoaB family molybdenum cofactor biosynthesis protein [Bacillus sp. AGMB 02131]|uniref:Molybdenum cofactor biosynthesis protein B n=1 Tax=Peribacillus faecalis TaxID=2772559 RepID=A0A927CWV2_9BACI|nr:MogA/MoaB family molybdenum cofactor biosynthesis protein [Peribacillus faecalis]MBD3107425.1 MogA/MoaB family molybdenum cofactor biosynthesis protein [Peribacillus faecalis]
MSHIEHKSQPFEQLRVMVLTISDTRHELTDKSGQLMLSLLKKNRYEVTDYQVVKDEKEEIEAALLAGCESDRIDVILTNGGTGLSKRDVTYEVIEELIEKTIPGYGEVFRMLSYEEIGSASMLSRAIAGIKGETVIFSTPGSTNAVRLAMEKLILPELHHIASELKK